MAAHILTRRGLLAHPAFAISELLRTLPEADTPGPEAKTAGGLSDTDVQRMLHALADLERASRAFQTLAAGQESVVRDLKDILRDMQEMAAGGEAQNRRQLVEDFLPLSDSLHRMSRALANWESGALAAGADRLAGRADDFLSSLGVEIVPTLGERFDPLVHQALEIKPAPPDMQGRVLEEISRGYRFENRILRAAHVIVGRRE